MSAKEWSFCKICGFCAAVVALGGEALRAQQPTGQGSDSATPRSAIAAAGIPGAETTSSGKIQARTAAQLQSAIYETNRSIAKLTEELSDLTNWETHIEIAISEVRNTTKGASEEINKRLSALKSAADELAKSTSPTKDDVVRVQDALDELESIDLTYPRKWLTLRSTVAFKTGVIEAEHLNPEKPRDIADARPAGVSDLENLLADSKPDDLKKKITSLMAPLTLDALSKWYDAQVARVAQYLTDLKRKVATVRAAKEDAVKAANTDLLALQQELIYGMAPQSEANGLIGWMMLLLFGLICVSLVARLIALAIARNYAGIIEEKTLIEFGGMAFILLAIVTLGNSGKLDPKQV